jgi:hypothetical protein
MAKSIKWERIAAIGTLVLLLAGSAIAWGVLSADVGHLKGTSAKLEIRSVQDGRDISGLKADVKATREDVREIKSMIQQQMQMRGGK